MSALPRVAGAGGCGADDAVRLDAVVLADKTRVAVTPPATMRCDLAEAVAHWVREDVAPAVRRLGALQSVDNYASYDCRGRNRVIGAKLSEHGRANALDMRSFKLANGTVVGLTSVHVAKDLRENLKRSACARFTTVLGPGSDGYHEDHVHVDLAARRGGHRMCQWDVREEDEKPAGDSDAQIPLPRPRPVARVNPLGQATDIGRSYPFRTRKRNGAGRFRPAPLAPHAVLRLSRAADRSRCFRSCRPPQRAG